MKIGTNCDNIGTNCDNIGINCDNISTSHHIYRKNWIPNLVEKALPVKRDSSHDERHRKQVKSCRRKEWKVPSGNTQPTQTG